MEAPTPKEHLVREYVIKEMQVRFYELIKKFQIPLINKIVEIIAIPALTEEMYSLKAKKLDQIIKRLSYMSQHQREL